MKNLRTFCRWLYKSGRIGRQPFEQITIPAEHYGTPIILTNEERKQIALYDLSAHPALAVQRDIFLFQCLSGCRVSDLSVLTSSNIQDGILIYKPQKTKNETAVIARVPLVREAQDLILKYKGKDPKGRLFPCISDQKYNESIKAFMGIMHGEGGILDRTVIVRDPITGNSVSKFIYEVASSHLARRTFINSNYQVIRDPNIIAQMSGHAEGSKAFNRYRVINDNILKDVVKQALTTKEDEQSTSDITESKDAPATLENVMDIINSSSLDAEEKARIIKAMMK